MEAYEQRLCISATGVNFNPDEITELIGIKPTGAIKIGQPINKRKICEKPVWYLHRPEKMVMEEFGDQWSRLYSEICGKESKFIEAKKIAASFVLSIDIVAREYVPGIFFEEVILKQISAFGFSIDIDVIL